MGWVRLMVLSRDEHAVIARLGELGVLQLTGRSTSEPGGPWASRDPEPALRHCRVLSERFAAMTRALGVSVSAVSLEAEPLSLGDCERQLAELEGQLGALSQRIELLSQQTHALHAELAPQGPYRALIEQLGASAHGPWLELVAGSVPEERWEEWLARVPADVVLWPLDEPAERRRFALLCCRGRSADLRARLADLGFEPDPSALDALRVAPEHHAARCAQLRRQQSELAELETERRELSAELRPKLELLAASLEAECAILEATRALQHTRDTVLLEGWLPAAAEEELRRHLLEVTRGQMSLEVQAPSGSRTVPVLLGSRGRLRAFASMVEGFGLPRYGDIEPTLFVAVTYVVMFGAMFGDLGHGALVAAAGLVSLRWSRTAALRPWAPMLLALGLSSMFFGLCYGSLLGTAFGRRVALWQDPIEGNPVSLMLAAIGFGCGMISLGLLLNVFNRWRRGDWRGALTDRFGVAGLGFYWGALTLALLEASPQEHRVVSALLGGLVLAMPALWLFEGGRPLHAASPPSWKRRLLGLAESAVEVFETFLVYLANTISFVRLAAYAMSHAALLLVVATLAEQLRSVPVLGGLLAFVLFVGGNVVVMALEGTVAAVQGLRLEYYEFFGKFFTGEGAPFAPFRLAAGTRFRSAWAT